MAKSSLSQFQAMLRRGGLLECAEAASGEKTADTLHNVEFSTSGAIISIAAASASLEMTKSLT
jgi:hypothetical protein